MAEQNRIATGAFINQLAGTSLEANRCPPKGLIESTGKVVIDGSYTSNQLVKETSIIKQGLFINNTVVLVNFGTTQIYRITIEFKNTVTGDSASVNAGGGFSNGSSRIQKLSEHVYAEGDGGLYISAVIINGASLNSSQIASKFNLRIGSSSTSGNLPLPST